MSTKTFEDDLLTRSSLEKLKGGEEQLKRSTWLYLGSKEIRTIASEVFDNLRNVNELDLSRNLLQTIDEQTFRGLSNLEKLNLSSNQLFEIAGKAFSHFANLKQLELQENHLRCLVETTFRGLVSLELLDLRDNHVSDIAANTFSHLDSLKELRLWRNKVLKVESNTFRGLINLEVLDLDSNQIGQLKYAFVHLSNLRELRLYENKLKRLDDDAFSGLEKLEKLTLATNQMREIGGNAFTPLVSLKELELQDNKLKRIDERILRGLLNLEKLDLRFNEIAEFDEKAFVDLTNLKQLSICGNGIEWGRVEEGTFWGLINLEVVYLDQNQMKEVNRELFGRLRSVQLQVGTNCVYQKKCGSSSFSFTKQTKTVSSQPTPKGENLARISPQIFKNVKGGVQTIQVDSDEDFGSLINRFVNNANVKKATIVPLNNQPTEKEAEKKEQELKEVMNKLEQENKRLQDEAFKREKSLLKAKEELKEKDPFSRYRLEYPPLGFGGFGMVYKVFDKNTSTFKAIKFIKKADPTALSELTSFVKLDHENILRYYDHFDHDIFDDIHTCIVVQFCENGDLSKQIKKAKNLQGKKLPDEKILNWMRQAANGLRYLHSDIIRIVHRDIKPGNLLLTAQDVLKIGDLGLAKSLQYSVAKSLAGTPPYMSPEQYDRTKEYEVLPYQTDVWALGCVLYELVHLDLAFSDEPRRIWKPTFGDLGIFKTILPKMLQIDPKDRPNSKELHQHFMKLDA